MNKFRYRKITPDKLGKMKELRKQGMNFSEIGKMFNVSNSTVQYWCKPEWRERCKRRSIINSKGMISAWKRNPDYVKKYLNERYHKDPEFREKCLERIRKTQKRLWEEGRTWNQLHPIKARKYFRLYNKYCR